MKFLSTIPAGMEGLLFKGIGRSLPDLSISKIRQPQVNIQLRYKLPPKIIDNVEEVKEAMVAEEVKEAMVAEEVKEAMVAKEVKDPIVAKGSEGTHGVDQESRGTHSGQGSDKLVSVYRQIA
ncbi:hypothetical protein IFM89_022399 [Coptis chinensis]|uniref:Uncharacterized protein n=1 Tax=Coptis chinensis TaxID=261450 RepID=A0A835IX89_9MAGN|nr:hypothetical protein IFM89_022399 [Coptis chinensis]